MGGKHYYCDYCDRSFKDAAGARKKHLESLQHLRNRDNYYKQFKDPKQILQEEMSKNPCKRYFQYGVCHFESQCKYSHYQPYQIQQLQDIVAAREQQSKQLNFPDTEHIMKEFFDSIVDPDELVEDKFDPWPLPDELKDYPNLPPSMRPMTLKDFDSADFAEWGKQ